MSITGMITIFVMEDDALALEAAGGTIVATVMIVYPGASPQVVEAQVTKPIEDETIDFSARM